MDQEQLLESTEQYLKSLFSEAANNLESNFDSTASFGELGIDSFYVLKIIKRLETDFGTLPKTLLFEHFNVRDLANYFINKHNEALSSQLFGDSRSQIQSGSGPVAEPAGVKNEQQPVSGLIEGNGGTPSVQNPLLMLESNALEHKVIGPLVNDLFERYKNESSVSRGTRTIAPNLFISSKRKGFFNYSRSNNIILVYSYTGPADHFAEITREIYQHCNSHGLELNVFSHERVDCIDEAQFSATPFGLMQRIVDLQEFSLKGGRMRRLRYQFSRFEKTGECETREYQCGSDESTARSIAAIIDKWCNAKTMVNPLVYKVKEEILAGTLSPRHRIFLTSVDGVVQNVILISAMAGEQNGYLMDLEFYPPDMPLGGLEFAIVKIIEVLVSEGCDMLSLGGTYGCKLESSPYADPEVDSMLDELREQGVFNDEGNLQFKNKFRPLNQPIYLCRPIGQSDPGNIIDIIMMIADPEKLQTSDEENHNGPKHPSDAIDPGSAKAPSQSEDRAVDPVPSPEMGALVIEGQNRSAVLADSGFNPLNLDFQHVDFDLKTDSWAQLESPFIASRMKQLHSRLSHQVDLKQALQTIFPFSCYALTRSGRTAEHVFYKASLNKGVVLQNLLFPTTIFHQIDNNFQPVELPDPGVFALESEQAYKGNIDLSALEKQLDTHVEKQKARDPEVIAFVCIEVIDNAAGGQPVSIQNLTAVKNLLARHAIPLVIDATRVVENARFIIDNEADYQDCTTWEVVREILSLADVVVASLPKDFSVTRGGLIATNDSELADRLQQLIDTEGVGLDSIDRKLIALALSDTARIDSQVIRRMWGASHVWHALRDSGVPVVHPAGLHCVLVDVKQLPVFAKFTHPIPSFLAWLYLNTGIRAGAHSVGMQADTTLNSLVRLAIPLGMSRDQVESVTARLVTAFERLDNIPELEDGRDNSSSAGDLDARYGLVAYHNAVGPVIPSTLESSSDSASGSELRKSALNGEGGGEEGKSASRTYEGQKGGVGTPGQSKDVAIVGMAGRYPKAPDLQQMWTNLIQGRDCIEEIPDERLAGRRQHGPKRPYRGGFIDDIDKFDSLFFNIAPREAESLDPQERLFLEVAWETLEDAGYHPENLVEEGAPRNIGVFVGAVWAMYQTTGAEERMLGNEVIGSSFLWSIANRVSYFLNLSGPSLTVDTACSASLTAMYLACEAIRKGDCAGAIVGGVNLDVHQCKQEITVAGGLLSEDGFCRAFGEGANGYVPGEGVGAFYLKPLDASVRDQDQIYGVIKSVVVNHGGRNSGYSVPNAKAQANLILAALKEADIDARSIGYIEAHGTGTELGDPIEISGLTTAFSEYDVAPQTCPIGSVKSNIGHLEAAAGIVGVTKVLLQMKHRQLVPSLHSKTLNEFIEFQGSPFFVEQQVEEWNPKVVDGITYPLRAGISSFGAGGSNAHIIIEQYTADLTSSDAEQSCPENSIYPLSARNEKQLRQAAVRLKEFLERDLSGMGSLMPLRAEDIAYTLQVGRKSFDCRLAIVAKSKEALVEKLGIFIDGSKEDQVITNTVKNGDGITGLLSRKELSDFIAMVSKGRDPVKLARLWVEGYLSDWGDATQGGVEIAGSARRVSLPTYPFADKRHWIVAAELAPAFSEGATDLTFARSMHPLIDSNQSTFSRQIFKKTFTSKDFVIYDHLVSDIPTLPGVAYLDMVRKAGELAAGKKVRKIKNILWVSPLTVEDSKPTEATIELKPSGDVVQFEVFTEAESGKKQLYSQGKLSYESEHELSGDPEAVDIAGIRARCEKVIEGNAAYPLFKNLGLNLGPSFQVLREVFMNEHEVLASLQLPDTRLADFADYVLHPSLVDGSFQALMGAQLGSSSGGGMVVPYSLGEVEIFHPLTSACFSYVTEAANNRKASSNLSKKDVMILDENGRVLVRIRDSVGVPLTDVHEKPSLNETESDEGFSRLYYSTVWEDAPLKTGPDLVGSSDRIVLFDEGDDLRNLYAEKLRTAGGDEERLVLVRPGNNFEQLDDKNFTINPRERSHFSRLFESLGEDSIGVGKVCFAWPSHSQSDSSLEEGLEKGVYAFLYLCQAIMERKLEAQLRLVYLFLTRQGTRQPQNEAMNGFAKILQAESPRLDCRVLEIQQIEPVLDRGAVDLIISELHSDGKGDLIVRYDGEKRQSRTIEQIELADDIETGESVWGDPGIKNQGVYLITGGAGGLGFIFAKYLAENFQAKLFLTGRSKLGKKQLDRLHSLEEFGAEIMYVSADVSLQADVSSLVAECRSRFGRIDGVIHSAGVLRDAYIKNKTSQELDDVFAPKIFGTTYLDEETKEDSLDFFVMFSSLAALAGNVGQCDYSFANHFMDSFASKRELLREKGERSGRSLSLNWSLWADGGMQLDEQTALFFRKNLGIKPLSAEIGLEAFIDGLGVNRSSFAVIEGVQEKIERAWGLKKDDPVEQTLGDQASASSTEKSSGTREAATQGGQQDSSELSIPVQDELTRIVMNFLKLDADDVDLDSILLDLGFDSIGLTTFSNSVNDIYGLDVTPVLFFEYPNIREIANYIATEHSDEVRRVHNRASSTAASGKADSIAESNDVQAVESPLDIGKGWTDSPAKQEVKQAGDGGLSAERRFIEMPIAIVGMSGVMPQSDNLEEFWENLRNAKNNMVTVIPEDRWSWQDYYGDPLEEENKTKAKWGGFMRSVDKFDPLFWGISPREAQMMDPQQRIFLESVWGAIEDAGHKVSDLAGTRTGLFVGASTRDYIDLMASLNVELDGYSASGTSHAVLANRVSFLLDLRGPSAPLDTACSSSLVALHRAIESIHTGSSDMAIVGGVQVMLTPAGHISFSAAGMLAADGKCKTFDERGDGYVRGEGSGAILIKPLTKAEADGNHIYAVVKATAENHGGRATMLTAPNPNSQAELLVEAYDKAEVDPSTVGYIECHGTGTSLGDPIEVQAMKKAFSELYKKHNKAPPDTPHIGLTSAKTNIGHLETAAGIAGILKVLLSIKHREIPALLHFEKLNPYINISGTPFYMVDKTQPWKAIQGDDGNPLPLRAGISSFGFGGANVHIVLEEYRDSRETNKKAEGPQFIVLSAKQEDRLKAYASLLLSHLDRYDIDLADAAYTLQVGRDAMVERVAFLVHSVEELKQALRAYIEGQGKVKNVFQGCVARGKDDMSINNLDDAIKRDIVTRWIAEGKYGKMLV